MKAMAMVVCAGLWLAGTQASAQEVVAPSSEVTESSGVQERYPWRVQLGGGIEGYTHHLAPLIQVGPTYGVSIAVDPIRHLGFELGYSGSLSELRNGPSGVENANPHGPDLIRNGGYLAVLPGYGFALDPRDDTEIKPYVLGGIGVDRYVPRGNTASFGYRAGTVASYPIGVGLQTRVGKVTADARFDYAFEHGDTWAPADASPMRYQGQLLVGAAF